MNSKEFAKALELLEERGVDKDYMYESMVLALTSAYKKHSGGIYFKFLSISLVSIISIVSVASCPSVAIRDCSKKLSNIL